MPADGDINSFYVDGYLSSFGKKETAVSGNRPA